MNASELLLLFPLLKNPPPGTVAVEQTLNRDGFFPVCRGRFGSEERRGVDLIVVGQDFGTREYSETRLAGAGEEWPQYFSLLPRWLQQAGLDYRRCLFTNSLLCLRRDNRLSGRSPAWRDAAYVDACADAFTWLTSRLAPKAIVFCGAPNVRFARLVSPTLKSEIPAGTSLSGVCRGKNEFSQDAPIGDWSGCIALSPHWCNPGNLHNPRMAFTEESVLATWRGIGQHVTGANSACAA